jgi:hypothetical protein
MMFCFVALAVVVSKYRCSTLSRVEYRSQQETMGRQRVQVVEGVYIAAAVVRQHQCDDI